MIERPKWFKDLEPPIGNAAEIASGLTGQGGLAIEPCKPESQSDIAVDLTIRKLSGLPVERQQAIRRLIAQFAVLKKYGLTAMTTNELMQIMQHLPE